MDSHPRNDNKALASATASSSAANQPQPKKTKNKKPCQYPGTPLEWDDYDKGLEVEYNHVMASFAERRNHFIQDLASNVPPGRDGGLRAREVPRFYSWTKKVRSPVLMAVNKLLTMRVKIPHHLRAAMIKRHNALIHALVSSHKDGGLGLSMPTSIRVMDAILDGASYNCCSRVWKYLFKKLPCFTFKQFKRNYFKVTTADSTINLKAIWDYLVRDGSYQRIIIAVKSFSNCFHRALDSNRDPVANCFELLTRALDLSAIRESWIDQPEWESTDMSKHKNGNRYAAVRDMAVSTILRLVADQSCFGSIPARISYEVLDGVPPKHIRYRGSPLPYDDDPADSSFFQSYGVILDAWAHLMYRVDIQVQKPRAQNGFDILSLITTVVGSDYFWILGFAILSITRHHLSPTLRKAADFLYPLFLSAAVFKGITWLSSLSPWSMGQLLGTPLFGADGGDEGLVAVMNYYLMTVAPGKVFPPTELEQSSDSEFAHLRVHDYAGTNRYSIGLQVYVDSNSKQALTYKTALKDAHKLFNIGNSILTLNDIEPLSPDDRYAYPKSWREFAKKDTVTIPVEYMSAFAFYFAPILSFLADFPDYPFADLPCTFPDHGQREWGQVDAPWDHMKFFWLATRVRHEEPLFAYLSQWYFYVPSTEMNPVARDQCVLSLSYAHLAAFNANIANISTHGREKIDLLHLMQSSTSLKFVQPAFNVESEVDRKKKRERARRRLRKYGRDALERVDDESTCTDSDDEYPCTCVEGDMYSQETCLKHTASSSTAFTAHSGDINTPAGPFSRFIASVSECLGLDMDLASFVKRCSQFSTMWRAWADLRKVCTWIVPAMIFVVNLVAQKMGYGTLFSDKETELRELLTTAANHIAASSVILTTQSDVAPLIVETHRIAQELQQAVALSIEIDPSSKLHAELRRTLTELKNLLIRLTARDVATRNRQVPVCIYLPGKAGIGKTQFAQQLARELFNLQPGPYLANDKIAMIDLGKNFQDELTDHATVICDEWMTVNDAARRREDVQWLLRDVNSTQKLIEKAGVEEKNLFWAAHQLTIVTTNTPISVAADCVSDINAVIRRIDFPIHIIPPALVNGQFPQTANGAIDWSQFSFQYMTYSNGDYAPNGQSVSYDVVVYDVAAALAKRGADYHVGHGAKTFTSGLSGAPAPPGLIPPPQPQPFVPVAAVASQAPKWIDLLKVFKFRTQAYKRFPTHLLEEIGCYGRIGWGRPGSPSLCFREWREAAIDDPEFFSVQPHLTLYDGDFTEYDYAQYVEICRLVYPKRFTPGLTGAKILYFDSYVKNVLKSTVAYMTSAYTSSAAFFAALKKLATPRTLVETVIDVLTPTSGFFALPQKMYRQLFKTEPPRFVRVAGSAFMAGLALLVSGIGAFFIGKKLIEYFTAPSLPATVNAKIYVNVFPTPPTEAMLYAQSFQGNRRDRALDDKWQNMQDSYAHADAVSAARIRARKKRGTAHNDDYVSSDTYISKNRPSHEARVAFERARGGKGQGGVLYRAQSPDSMIGALDKCTVFIYNKYGMEMRGLGIYDRVVMFPHHYCFPLRETEYVKIVTKYHTATIHREDISVHHEAARDLMFWMLPNIFPAFPSLVQRFAQTKEYKNIGSEVHLYDTRPDSLPTKIVLSGTCSEVSTEWVYVDYDGPKPAMKDKTHVYAASVLTSAHASVEGDCGMVYVTPTGEDGATKVLGIHVAGADGVSVAALVSKDFAFNAMAKLYLCDTTLADEIPLPPRPEPPTPSTYAVAQGPGQPAPSEPSPSDIDSDPAVAEDALPPQTFTVFELSPEDQAEISDPFAAAPPLAPFDCGLEAWQIKPPSHYDIARRETSEDLLMPTSAQFIGVLDKPIHTNWDTAYVPGPLAQEFPVPPGGTEYAPAVLSKRSSPSGVCPLSAAFARQVPKPYEDYSPDLMLDCARAAIAPLGKHARRGVKGIDFAILGRRELTSIDASASAGFPYNQYAASRKLPQKKGSFYSYADGKLSIDDGVVRDFNEAMEQLRKGVSPMWPVVAQLKDEIVTREKVVAAKTRLYYVANLVHALVGRALFGDFITQLAVDRKTKPLVVSCSVGLTPGDHVIQRYAAAYETGDYVSYAADQKGWDNHQHWEFAQYVTQAINEWYGDPDSPDAIARTTYIKSCYHSVYISGRYVYRMAFGLPSGMCITSQLNSLYLEMTTLYAVYQYMRRTQQAYIDKAFPKSFSPYDVKRSMPALFYGDDSMFLLPKIFGMTSRALFTEYDKLGLEATHCVKDHPLDQEIPFVEQTFLKRSFRKNPDGHYTYALDRDTIIGSFRWIKRKNANRRDVLINTIANAQLEASRHGEVYFNEITARIKAGLERLNIRNVSVCSSIANVSTYYA